jgi:hypothetical protein
MINLLSFVLYSYCNLQISNAEFKLEWFFVLIKSKAKHTPLFGEFQIIMGLKLPSLLLKRSGHASPVSHASKMIIIPCNMLNRCFRKFTDMIIKMQRPL